MAYSAGQSRTYRIRTMHTVLVTLMFARARCCRASSPRLNETSQLPRRRQSEPLQSRDRSSLPISTPESECSNTTLANIDDSYDGRHRRKRHPSLKRVKRSRAARLRKLASSDVCCIDAPPVLRVRSSQGGRRLLRRRRRRLVGPGATRRRRSTRGLKWARWRRCSGCVGQISVAGCRRRS
eukprot:6185119-Pleurochrysis_carterae.AAC.4